MLKTDIHTHSIASGHALNTVDEIVREAKERGMGVIGIAEHGPAMDGAPHEGYFWVSDQLDELYGVRVFLGVEANILNEKGEIDLKGDLLAKQRMVLAGLHARTPYRTNDLEHNTRALINAMQNPLVQIISHPYRTEFPVDIEEILDAAVRTNTLLELNNQVFSQQASHVSFLETYKRLVDLSKRYGHPLIAGSDAHVAKKVGEDSAIAAVYEKIGLTEDMLLNNYPKEFIPWKKRN